MAISPAVSHHRARVGALSRDRAPDDPDLLAARKDLAYAGLTEHAAKVVAGWPEPTDEHLQRIAGVLRAGGAAWR